MRRRTKRILDDYLAASARSGDRAAFEQLAARWQGKLYAHACRLTGDAELALDVAQDGWSDIVRGLPKLDDTAAFPAWAYRIVTRRAADAIRRAGRTRRLNAAYAGEPKPQAQNEDSIEAYADSAPLQHALAALPPEQRAAVALFYREDLSIAEIAAVLGVPAGTVKTRLMHARKKLRASLEGGKSDE
ncbi:MAG: RNA polymerase sigma factor [Hyphococcus sp.]